MRYIMRYFLSDAVSYVVNRMTRYMKKIPRRNTRNKNILLKKGNVRGFTLIETMVSLLLVFLALLIMAQITTSAIEAYKRSRDGFYLLQEMEAFKNSLLGKPFDDSLWQEGSHVTTSIPFQIQLEVQDLGPGLKQARLTFTYINKYLKVHTHFYKSLYITNKVKTSR